MSSLPLWASGVIGVGIFFVLMFLKMHVGFALMAGGFVGWMLTKGFVPATENLASSIFEAAHSGQDPVLVIIPLFVVMGTIAGAGGPIGSAFGTFNKWLGHWRGGLAMAAVGSCAAFGAVCGDNIATAMTMDKAALPQMRKYGYKDTLSFGSIAAGGNLGIMIPPSAAFVVFSFIAMDPNANVANLFIAGVIPGLLLTVMFMAQIWIQTRISPSLCAVQPKAPWRERLISLKGIIAILLGFLIVMVGLLTAIFTPAEAGALGAFAMLIVSLPYRQLTWEKLLGAFLDAIKTSAMILVLIFGARYFSKFLTSTNIAMSISDAILNAGLHKYTVMFMVALLLLILGCLMDIWSVMIITIPIFYDLLVTLGFEPLQIGVITVLCIMLGCITPPVGVVVFSLAGAHREVPMYTIFKGVLPFLVTMVILLVLLIFVPQLSTWLPGLMGSG